MTSLKEQLSAYAAYHHDSRNKITHFFGVPLVMFALFLLMGWFRFMPVPDLPFMSVATVFWLAVFYGCSSLFNDIDGFGLTDSVCPGARISKTNF